MSLSTPACLHARRRSRPPRLAILLVLVTMAWLESGLQAQEDTSLSPTLSEPIGDSLTSGPSASGFSSEVVAGASTFGGASRRNGISDPTGSLLENSTRSPYVFSSVNSDPGQQFVPEVNVDSPRASAVDVYSGSRAAFQPAFSGTLIGSFRTSTRAGTQRAAGLPLTSTGNISSAAFGRGTQLQAFGSTGYGDTSAADITGNPGDPLVYRDPQQTPNSTLVTAVGSIPGQASYLTAGTPSFAVLPTGDYGGAGSFPDSTRGTAGAPPEFAATESSPFLSPTGMGESPFPSLSQSGSRFLRPTLLVPSYGAHRTTSAATTEKTPAERRARMLALLSGNGQQSTTPTFEQKREDRLRHANRHPGERPSLVTLSPAPGR